MTARKRSYASARARLLCGVAILVLSATAAAARTHSLEPRAPKPAAPVPGASETALGQDGFYLEGNEMVRDDKADTITATGQVEVRYRGRTLRTDKLFYDNKTGEVTATGDVVIVNADGTAEFAKELALDKEMRTGVALAFSARLQHNVKIAASTAVRRSQTINELNQAIYTPCDICAKDGTGKTPTWSIRASKVIQDSDRHLITYRNAVIRMFGVPVFYSPVFWSADPNVLHRSGLLVPRIEFSGKRGASYDQPYYQTLGDSADLTVTPIISTKINPFLNLDLRKEFNSGAIDVRAGYTYEKEFNADGDRFGQATSRSYLLASGAFRIDDKWQWGFSAERVSDQLLFDRYDIPDVYEKRGLFETDSRRLLSQLFAVRQDQSSYISISALGFQGLQLVSIDPPVPENDAAFPLVAPLIEARWRPDQDILGGRLNFTGSAVVLTRNQAATVSAGGVAEINSRRASADVDWRRSITLSPGIRIEPFGDARVDSYSLEAATAGGNPTTTVRGLATAGVDVSWPFIRRDGDTTVVLEPLFEAAVSPRANPNPNIPNEDSQVLPFDETNLFDPNRVSGFDIYDSGPRFNVGGRATFDWGGGTQARVLVGRSFRTETNLMIPAYSGYNQAASDWVAAGSITPMRGLSLYGRTLLDPNSLGVQRAEAGVNFSMSFIQGYARYYYDATNPLNKLHNIEAAADIFVTKHWGFVVYGARDIERDVWSRRDAGIVYRDECARIELVYHHEDISILNGGTSNSVQLRLTLATLGDPGYTSHDDR